MIITLLCPGPFQSEKLGNGLLRRQEWNLKHIAVGLHACTALVLLHHASFAPSQTHKQLAAHLLLLCCMHSPHLPLYLLFFPHCHISSYPIFFLFFPVSLFSFSFFPPCGWFSFHSFIHSFLSSLIYLFRANSQIYKPITAKRLCWGSFWACRCGGSWIPITELIWKKTLSVMWKWFGLRVKFIIITLISSQASALAAAKENTKA